MENQAEVPPLACCPLKSKLICVSAGLVALVIVAVASFVLGRASVKSSSLSQTLPTPAVTIATPTLDETADWKTYTNSQFHFSIRYPSNFISNENNQDPSITTLSKIDKKGKNGEMIEGFSLSIFSELNNNFKTVDQIINEHHTPDQITTTKTININGQNITRISGHGMYQFDEAIVLRSGGYVIITGLYGTNSDQYAQLFDQILSTFKFLD